MLPSVWKMFPLWKLHVPISYSDATLHFQSFSGFYIWQKDCGVGGLFWFVFLFSLVWKTTRFCGVCGSIVLLYWWVPWYGWHRFAVIWNWIRGAGEGGRDDEEYQSFCLLCEVICGSTESAIMKVHLFTTEGLWVNLLSLWHQTWNKGRKPLAEEAMSIQSEWLLTSVCPHNVCYDNSLRGFVMLHWPDQTEIAMSIQFYHPHY